MKRIVLTSGLLLVFLSSSVYSGDIQNVYYSALFPGWGQVKSGHYGKGALLVSAELVSLVSLAITQIQYNRAVEQYDSARKRYLNSTYIGDAVSDYRLMKQKWDDSERLYRYRNTLIGAAIGVYVINIIDIVFFCEDKRTPITLHVGSNSFVVTTGFSF